MFVVLMVVVILAAETLLDGLCCFSTHSCGVGEFAVAFKLCDCLLLWGWGGLGFVADVDVVRNHILCTGFFVVVAFVVLIAACADVVCLV